MSLGSFVLGLFFAFSHASNCVPNPAVKKGCESDVCNTIPDAECNDYLQKLDVRMEGFSLPTFCIGTYPCKLAEKGKRVKAAAAPKSVLPVMDPDGRCPNFPRVTCSCDNWHKGRCVGHEGEKLECMQIDDNQVDRRRDEACMSAANAEWCCGTDAVDIKIRRGQVAGEGKDKYKGFYDETVKPKKSTASKPKRVSASQNSRVWDKQNSFVIFAVSSLCMLMYAISINRGRKLEEMLTTTFLDNSHLAKKLYDEEL